MRGKICDRDAIARALESGQLAGYAGDVWFPQPAPKDHPWRTMPHHGMTAHAKPSSAISRTDPVTLQMGTFTTTIPAGSFKKDGDGSFSFKGVIGDVSLEAHIKPTGTLRYAFLAVAEPASLIGITNPVPVMLTIGDDSGMISVKPRTID